MVSRENEVRERILHTCPSSYDNFFQSIFVSASCSVAILMSTCYWSVRVTSFNFKLCGGLSGNAVAIWPVTGQGFQNTKWPAVLYSQ